MDGFLFLSICLWVVALKQINEKLEVKFRTHVRARLNLDARYTFRVEKKQNISKALILQPFCSILSIHPKCVERNS